MITSPSVFFFSIKSTILPTAFFVFQSTPAGARVVPSWLLGFDYWLGRGLFNIINAFHGRNAERESRFAINIGDGEITLGYNIHANKHIYITEVVPCDWHHSKIHIVRQENVDSVDIDGNLTCSGDVAGYIDGGETKFRGNASGYGRNLRTSIPYGCDGLDW